MSVYFTNNQYLKTAEEDFEAADALYGHKYYDQIVSLLSIAMTKFLKSVVESMFDAAEAHDYYNTEDKIAILKKIQEKEPDFPITEKDCKWMDSVYGKANCTDGIHMVMPKQTAMDAFHLVAGVRKEARRADKQYAHTDRSFFARFSK